MKNKHNKICLIACWYGEYPWYFQYFIKSCRHNTSIDFILITDNKGHIPYKPNNVKVVFKTLNEIKALASAKLGFSVRLDYPYKICDFRPAYKFLFPEILVGYAFWGSTDIDVIHGDIRAFLSEDLLNNYDVISSRHDYLTGSFFLFRNTDKINRLFMESKDFRLVFSEPQHFCFDECNFLHRELQDGRSIFEFTSNIQSMTFLIKKAEAEGRLKAFFDFMVIEGTPGKITWDRGKIYYKDEFEAMHYHLVHFKNECINPKAFDQLPDTLYFTDNEISIFKSW